MAAPSWALLALDCSAALVLILPASGAWALELSVVGLFTNKAVLVIDGGPPRTLSVGSSSAEGVKLLAVADGVATVEVGGKRQRLAFGERAYSQSGTSSAQELTLAADSRGHFITDGSINGATMRFMVDTGASVVSMGPADADRAGIDYKTKGRPAMSSTANGMAQTWRVKADSVRLGNITLNNVDVAVMSQNMPEVLLGMSFLNQMEMRRDGSTMTLKRRF